MRTPHERLRRNQFAVTWEELRGGTLKTRLLLSYVLICFLVQVSEAHTAQSSGKSGWELEWERTVKAAEREGEVSYYTVGEYGFVPEFEKKFPRIKVKVIPGRGNDLLS